MKGFEYGLLGGAVYFISIGLLPDWNPILAGVLGGLILVAVYYLVPQKLTPRTRCLISSAITILIVCIIRFLSKWSN